MALGTGHFLCRVFGSGFILSLTRFLRILLSPRVPLWVEPMPAPAKGLPRTSREGAAAIYFPSCISRTMGELPGEPDGLSVAEAFVAVAARAGSSLHIPDGVRGRCCGVPYSSKGFGEAHHLAVNDTVAWLWTSSDEGKLPVVVDTSPCVFGLRSPEGLSRENRERLSRMRILDGVEFFTGLLPHLTVKRRAGAVALHPVCSLVKMDLTGKLEALARACADVVTVPSSAGCCGFAGDRGWLFPELTASAMKEEAAEITASGATECASSSRTCEVAVARATDLVTRSFIHLLEHGTRE